MCSVICVVKNTKKFGTLVVLFKGTKRFSQGSVANGIGVVQKADEGNYPKHWPQQWAFS